MYERIIRHYSLSIIEQKYVVYFSLQRTYCRACGAAPETEGGKLTHVITKDQRWTMNQDEWQIGNGPGGAYISYQRRTENHHQNIREQRAMPALGTAEQPHNEDETCNEGEEVENAIAHFESLNAHVERLA